MSKQSSDIETDVHYSLRELIRDLFVFLRPYRASLIAATFARLASDIAWLYPAYALAAVVTFCSSWQSGDSVRPLVTIFVIWAGAFFIRYFGQYVSRGLGFRASEQASLDAKQKGMEHLFDLDLAWHEQENAGNKLKRIERGGEGIDRIVRIWINNLIEIIVFLVGMVFILATVDLMISLVTIIFLVTFYLLSTLLTRPASAAAREVNAKEEDLSGVLYEGVNNIRTAKVLNMRLALIGMVQTASAEVMQKVGKRISRFQSRNLVVGLYSNAFRMVVLAIIVKGVLAGHYEVGFLLLFWSYFSRVQEAVTELSDVQQDFIVAKYGIARMMAILKTPVYQDGKEAVKSFPKNWKTISLQRVSFSYGDDRVLDDISFDIHRGERVGLIGLSGAGKSTLFKLLLKENEDYSGEILVDGLSLKKIKKTSYYEHATVVLQETEVFNISLKENIVIANPSSAKDDKALKKALDIAHVSSFLSRLPNGVDTLIGEKGIKLSGGERQRVGIARAVFKNPELLFLDEATSHLDLESEEKIRDSLHIFFQQVTAVVIAHRLTTIKEMDRILVLEKGELIETGTFDELYALDGRFKKLWDMQKLD